MKNDTKQFYLVADVQFDSRRAWETRTMFWDIAAPGSMDDVRNGSKQGVSLVLSASYGVTSHYLAFVERRDAILAASSLVKSLRNISCTTAH